MSWTVYEIFLNTLQSVIFVTFIHSILTPRRKEMISYVICIILTSAALSSYIFFDMPDWDTWTFLFTVIYALLFFKDSPAVKLFWCAVMLICVSVFASLTYMLASLILKDTITVISEPGLPRVAFTLFYTALLFAAYFLLVKLLPKNINTTPSLLLLVAIDTICVLLIDTHFSFLFDDEIPVSGFFIASSLTGLIGILTVILYILLDRYAKREEQYRYQQALLKDSLSRAEDLRSVYDSMLKLRHDMRAYVNDVQGMIERGDILNNQPYLNDLEAQVADLFSTGNTALDSVLSVKYAKMQKNGIEFRGSGLHYTHQLKLDDYSLCSLISNMLDNAIEAMVSRKDLPGEHYVSLRFDYTANGLMIICANPLLGVMPQKKKDSFLSKKKEPYHGLGISIMKQITENADGELDTVVDGDLFSVMAFIPV